MSSENKNKILTLIIVLLVFFICVFVVFLVQKPKSQAQIKEFSTSIESLLFSDYSIGEEAQFIPSLSPSIIADILRDQGFSEEEIQSRLEKLDEVLNSPIISVGPIDIPEEIQPTQETPPTEVVTVTEEPTPVSQSTPSPPPSVYQTPTQPPPSPPPPVVETPTPEPTPDAEPSIQVQLVSSPNTVLEPGAQVSYTVNITNTSQEIIEIISIGDNLHGDLNGQGTCNSTGNPYPTSLTSGLSYGCTYLVTISGNAGYSETNTVIVNVRDDDGDAVSSSVSTTVTVTDSIPVATVNKTNDADGDNIYSDNETTPPGASVTFRVEITNSSTAEAITITNIVDDIHTGALVSSDLTDIDCEDVINTLLAIGASTTCYFDSLVGSSIGTEVDTVTVTFQDDDGNIALTANDTSTVVINNPACNATTSLSIDSSSTIVSLDIQNNETQNIIIETLFVSWPSANGQIIKVLIDSLTLYETPFLSPPSATISTWSGGQGNRQITSGNSKIIEIYFENNVAATGYSIEVAFDTNCSVFENVP